MSTIQSSVFSAILAWLTFVPLAVLHLCIYEKFQNLNNYKDTLWLAYYGLQFVWFLGIIIDFYSWCIYLIIYQIYSLSYSTNYYHITCIIYKINLFSFEFLITLLSYSTNTLWITIFLSFSYNSISSFPNLLNFNTTY